MGVYIRVPLFWETTKSFQPQALGSPRAAASMSRQAHAPGAAATLLKPIRWRFMGKGNQFLIWVGGNIEYPRGPPSYKHWDIALLLDKKASVRPCGGATGCAVRYVQVIAKPYEPGASASKAAAVATGI